MFHESNPFRAETDPRLLRALGDFMIDYFAHPGEKDYMPWEIDIRDPHEADMESIRDKKITIADLRIAPGVKGSRSFHFYVGQTEFHIAGRASGRIEDMLRQAA
jgi:hypothetical protein